MNYLQTWCLDLLFSSFPFSWYTSICSDHAYLCYFRYASRVRSIVNDPSKNISSKEVARLKKLVTYWKEQAGRTGDGDELEEIQEERPTKDRTDCRHSM